MEEVVQVFIAIWGRGSGQDYTGAAPFGKVHYDACNDAAACTFNFMGLIKDNHNLVVLQKITDLVLEVNNRLVGEQCQFCRLAIEILFLLLG